MRDGFNKYKEKENAINRIIKDNICYLKFE